MDLSSIALHAVSYYWVAHSGLSLTKAIRAHRLYSAHRQWLDSGVKPEKHRKVALIIAAKGISENFERFLDFILTQDYPYYRVIFVTQSESDPAHTAIQARLETGKNIRLISAGLAENTAQKVHNQRAALSQLTPEDEIIAFADADLYGRTDWLSCMVLPINQGQSDLTTGYRWFLPADRKLANLIISSLSLAMESWSSKGWRTVLWGGSMALSRETYEELSIYKNLSGSLNDDVLITNLATKAGKKIRYVRSAEAITPVDYTIPSLYEFGTRQYKHLWLYRSIIPKMNVLFSFLYLLSFSTCLALLFSGNPLALAPIILASTSNILRQKHRKHYLTARFSGNEQKHLLSLNANSWWVDPLERLATLAISVSSYFTKEITWGAIRYRIHGPHSIEITERDT